MSFKIIFSDIDGTLLNSHHQILPNSISAIHTLSKAGITFVPVSARMPAAIKPIICQIGIKTPIISYNGALILSAQNKKIYSKQLPPDSCHAIIKKIHQQWPQCIINYYTNDCWYVENISPDNIQTEIQITGVTPVIKNFPALLTNKNLLPHKLLCMASPMDCAHMETMLSDVYPELTIVRSSPTLLEIVDKSISKARAVKIFLSHYAVIPAQSIAFGDNYNDIGMLAEAGIGIAMGNAPQTVKASADKITATNDNDGIYAALHTLGLV
ncbi:Cof-type HAD-IIB family hydrolase [Pectinatus frisingensis]|uniref:Cof-type HAD-IIB family hydrolase n=1 Tax=Pectinatus frisingensis TaxID=865 RepID=UPI0018C45C65|nr:Cof-type HAD-IIB family hydrolase [Pectinatus frisingensis]